jgi:hypothetical protein
MMTTRAQANAPPKRKTGQNSGKGKQKEKTPEPVLPEPVLPEEEEFLVEESESEGSEQEAEASSDESSSEESEAEIPDHEESSEEDLSSIRHDNDWEAGPSGREAPITKPKRNRNHASEQQKGHTRKIVKDENFYKERLPRGLFQKISNPVQFLRRCAVYREACEVTSHGLCNPAATNALRRKLVNELQCTELVGLTESASKGRFNQTVGLVLQECFDYDLRKARIEIRNMRQNTNESLKEYTSRAIALWQAIDILKSVDDGVLDFTPPPKKKEAVRIWALGITDERLEEFKRLGMDDKSLWNGEVSEIMEHRREAERWLAGRELIRSHRTHNPAPTRNKQQQRPVVATMAPPTQVEPADGGRERRIPRPRRGRPEGPQREDQNRHEAPCRICQKGTINRRKGCSNVLCPTKIVFCRDCQEMTYHLVNGCSTAGCKSNRGTSQPLGNGRVRE